MKMTVDAYMARNVFVGMDRDYYSMEALETLINYYDEIDENMEFDPVAICCEWDEYGDWDCALDFKNLAEDYDRFAIEGLENPEKWETFSEEEKAAKVAEAIEDETTVFHLNNGNYLVMNF